MLFLLAASFSAQGASAQEITGTITGFVRDSSGAVVPGAMVTVKNTATGQERKVTTGDAGEYAIPLLPIGPYTVMVEKSGFKKYLRENIVLHVNERLPVDVELQVGAIEETVTIIGAAPLVKTETHTVESLITGEMIRELPLNNRNFAQLTQIAPGVSSTQGSTLGFGGLTGISISINGGRTTAINFSLDGARNVDTGSNNTLFNYPSVDAIAEFNIMTNSYDAQFGRNGSGVVNVVTRSGGRDFHGAAYEFLRNDKLQARNPFLTAPLRGISHADCFAAGANPSRDERCRFKGPLRYNNFGYNVGGPVWIPKLYGSGRDKTFFFFSQEFRRIRETAIRFGQYPTAAQRQGVFTTTITDPRTGQPFPNNTIPADRIDRNARQIIDNFMPLPNSPTEGPNAFRTTGSAPTNFHQELVRIDHNFSDKVKVWGRYIHDNTGTEEIGGLFNGLVFPGVATTATNTPADNVVVRLTTVISPTLLNEVGYDFARNEISSEIIGRGLRANFSGIQIPEVFPGSPGGALPAITISGFSTPLAFFGPFLNDNPSHTVTDNFTWNKGTHTFKAGVLISHEAKNENAGGGATPGNFSFTGRFSGNALADFMLGLAQSYAEDQTDVRVQERYNAYEWYAQDAWRARRNLTLTYGVRHSIFLNPTDINNILISFLPQLYNPARAVRLNPDGTIAPGSGDRFNGIIFAGQNSPYGERVQSSSYNTIGPRVGFAWDPFDDGKMAIRGGYGMYFDRSLIGIVEQNGFSDPRANQRVNIDNTFLSNPSGGAPNTAIFPLGLTATGDPFKVPTTHQWSLGVQRQLGSDVAVEVTYAGSHGNHLLHQFNLNQPRPLVAQQRGVGLNFVRPFIGFGNINVRETTANSVYHALQTSFRKRFTHGLMLNANYTFGKTLTDSSNDRTDTPQNTLDYRIERGRASFQRTHVFTFTYLWEIPFPKQANALVRGILGGWQAGGTTFFWSGVPLTITQGGDLLTVGGNTRPNLIGHPEGPKTIAQWFNTAAFTPATTTFGTSGRGVVTGPGVNNWDISLVKNFRWGESLRLRFSTDFVNAFNHRILGNPNTGAVFSRQSDGSFRQTNADFGRITSVGREPRIIQFGLKFSF
jgi:hypothetical protein